MESLKNKSMENKTEKDMEKAAQTTIDGGISPEQVAQWKQKHGKVLRIDVVDGDEMHVGYFHRPKLETMAAVTKVAKTDEIKSAEVMFDNCWLGGSSQLRQDAILFLEVTKKLGDMFSSCLSSIKNL